MHGRRGALARFLTRRLLSAVVVVFIVASTTLVLSAAADGDYFSIALGFGRSPRTAASARAALGFDRPVSAIYLAWLTRASRLDFGTSPASTRSPKFSFSVPSARWWSSGGRGPRCSPSRRSQS